MEAHLANTRPGGPGPLLLEKAAEEAAGGPPHKQPEGEAGGKQAERIREAVRAHQLETQESGALEVGWILAVSKAAKVSGKLIRMLLGQRSRARAGGRYPAGGRGRVNCSGHYTFSV